MTSFFSHLIAVVCCKRHLHNHLIPYMQSVNTDLMRKRERQHGFKHGEILTCDQEWDHCVSFTPLKRCPAKAVKQHQSIKLQFSLPTSNFWCIFCLWYIFRVWLGVFLQPADVFRGVGIIWKMVSVKSVKIICLKCTYFKWALAGYIRISTYLLCFHSFSWLLIQPVGKVLLFELKRLFFSLHCDQAK